jgi:transcription factor C subunit 6
MASASDSERKASKMKKGKGKANTPAKPRGKATKWAVADDDSGSEYEKASEEEEEEDEDELEEEAALPADIEAELHGTDGEEDEDMSASDIEPVSLSTPKPSAPRAPFTGAPSHSKQAAYVQTESNLIPQHYRELIKKHAEAIAAPIRGNANAEEKAREYKTRALDPDILPHGPSTPFVTRLKREVRGKERAEIIYDDRFLLLPGKEDDKTARQAHATQCVKGVTLLSPWQVWQGEGWWPEMATKVGPVPDEDANGTSAASLPAPTKHKGKGRASASVPDSTNAAGGPPGWILREQVRLGLESVGRYRTGELKFIQEP